MSVLDSLHRQHDAIVDRMEQLSDVMKDRQLNSDEHAELVRLEQEQIVLARRLADAKAEGSREASRRVFGDPLTEQPQAPRPEDFYTVAEGPYKGANRAMLCRGGFRPLSKGESFSQIFGKVPDTPNGFGEFVAMIARGADDFTPGSVKNVQTGGTDSAGGYLVPEILSGVLIDKARAMMVTTMAGFATYPLSSDNLTIPQVVTDPTFAAYAEATTIAASDIVFGAAILTPKKIAGIVNASNEVVEDGISFPSRVQDVMARALAVAVDDQLLNGDGTGANVLGLFNQPGINTTTLSGPVTRAAIDAAVEAVRGRNHEPTAVILSPANYHALSLEQTSGSGEWLGPPQSSSTLAYYASTAIADTELAVGDFSNYAIGIRTALRLEISRMGGNPDAWTDDLTSFRAVSRIDGVPTDASAIQIIDGIT